MIFSLWLNLLAQRQRVNEVNKKRRLKINDIVVFEISPLFSHNIKLVMWDGKERKLIKRNGKMNSVNVFIQVIPLSSYHLFYFLHQYKTHFFVIKNCLVIVKTSTQIFQLFHFTPTQLTKQTSNFDHFKITFRKHEHIVYLKSVRK